MIEPIERSVGDARQNFAEMLAEAAEGGQVTFVTRYGRRIAAVVPVEVAEAHEAQRSKRGARSAA